MNFLIIIATLIMIALVSICLVVAFKKIVLLANKVVYIPNEIDVRKDLDILGKTNIAAHKKANCSYRLIEKNYIQVPVITNSEDKYNDEQQKSRFCNGITPERIIRLNALEIKQYEL